LPDPLAEPQDDDCAGDDQDVARDGLRDLRSSYEGERHEEDGQGVGQRDPDEQQPNTRPEKPALFQNREGDRGRAAGQQDRE
jgi:hypothetical protein